MKLKTKMLVSLLVIVIIIFGILGFILYKTYNMNEELMVETSSIFMSMIIAVLIALVVFAIIIFLVIKKIVKPLNILVKHAKKIGDGDLTLDVPQELLDREDEIGLLAKALDKILAKMRELIKDVLGNTFKLSSCSKKLNKAAEKLDSDAKEDY